MSYQILSSKWRPQSFDQIIGQEHITRTLKNAISMDRLAHAFLFSGPRGVGKTTTARVLAATVNSVSNYSDCLDIIELDGASNRGIDEIREIRESVKFPPTSVRYKVYIIDEAHMLTEQAFNALLKTLEEPPSYIIFILATTDPQKMPQTILSRTQRYDFMRMSSHAIIDRLKFILSEEKIEYASDSLDLIAQKSDGSMRDALSMLDQIIAFSDNKITVKNIRSAIGLIDQEDIFELFEYVMNQDADSAIKKYNLILETGVSSKVFIDDLCSFLNEIMLIKINPNNDKIFLYEELKNNIYSKIPFQMNDILRMLNISLRLSSAFKKIDNVKISIEVLIMKFISIIAQNSRYNQFSKSNSNIPKSDLKSNDNNELIKDNQNEIEERPVIRKEAVEPEILSHNSDEISSKDAVNITNSNNNEKLDFSDVEKFDLLQQNWEDILSKIDETNGKLSSFLEETQIISLSDNVLHLEVNNGNSFIKKVIDTDQSIIKDIIKNTCKLEVTISVKVNKALDEKEEVSIENTKEENHPLLDDAINIFKGKIIS